MCLRFVSFPDIDTSQVVEIMIVNIMAADELATQGGEWLSLTAFLEQRIWQRKEPRYQQPWYLLCWTVLIQSLHNKGEGSPELLHFT